MTVASTHSTFLCFPDCKEKKLKGRHFDTIEVTEAKSQAVLNTLTEHNFHDEFKKKKLQKRWEWCICTVRDF
jgi:hypothetical protein